MSDNPCEVLLKDGLYARLNITKSQSFEHDFKKYIESDQFREDYRSRKIDFGIEIFDPTTLISESLDFGASEDKVNKFQQWVREKTTIKVKSKFFNSYVEAHPDEGLAQQYVECLKLSFGQKGLSSSISRDQNIVRINIFYNKIAFSDPEPTVEKYDLSNCSVTSISFKTGDKLDLTNSVVLKIVDESKPAVFSLDTDKGSLPLIIPSDVSKNSVDMPVGTVITSFLTWREFESITNNNKHSDGVWRPDKCLWSPCDGRDIANSAYSKHTGQSKLPDLRGLFLRGLNVFDAEGEFGHSIAKVDTDKRDPDERSRGSFQADDFKSHSHPFRAAITTQNIRGPGGGAPEIPSDGKTGLAGGAETRPKNCAVFYYIRIN